MRICFDLDSTLCFGLPYSIARPFPWARNLLRQLKDRGYTIIIYTARKMSTHDGNIGRVNKDIAYLTLKQLDEWGFVYDEIYFGKPAADIYIDDKGLKFVDEKQLKEQLGDLI